MGQLKFQASTYDVDWLESHSFVYSRVFSDPDNPVYIYRVPVYRWGLIATLEAEFRLHIRDGEVTVDVYDGSGSTRGVYAPFYYEVDYCHKDFLGIIYKNIDKECERLGFTKK